METIIGEKLAKYSVKMDPELVQAVRDKIAGENVSIRYITALSNEAGYYRISTIENGVTLENYYIGPLNVTDYMKTRTGPNRQSDPEAYNPKPHYTFNGTADPDEDFYHATNTMVLAGGGLVAAGGSILYTGTAPVSIPVTMVVGGTFFLVSYLADETVNYAIEGGKVSDFEIGLVQTGTNATISFVEGAAISGVVSGVAVGTGKFFVYVLPRTSEKIVNVMNRDIKLPSFTKIKGNSASVSGKVTDEVNEILSSAKGTNAVEEFKIYTHQDDINKIWDSKRVWGKTEGSVYGMKIPDASAARTMILPKTRDPGMIVFSDDAAELFTPHEVWGPLSLIKRALGQHKGPFGDIVFDQFTRSGNTIYVTQAHVASHAGQSALKSTLRLQGRRAFDLAFDSAVTYSVVYVIYNSANN